MVEFEFVLLRPSEGRIAKRRARRGGRVAFKLSPRQLRRVIASEERAHGADSSYKPVDWSAVPGGSGGENKNVKKLSQMTGSTAATVGQGKASRVQEAGYEAHDEKGAARKANLAALGKISAATVRRQRLTK